MNNFAQKPTDLAGFDDVFNLALTGSLDDVERKKYVSTMLNEYEKYIYGEYARREGYKEGREEEKTAMAQKLRDLGVDSHIIQQATGFTKEQVDAL